MIARPLPLLVCDLSLCAARGVSLGSAAQDVRSAGRKHDLMRLLVRPPLEACDATMGSASSTVQVHSHAMIACTLTQ